MRQKIIADITNNTRQSRWTLIQEDDGSLHIEQEAEYPTGDHKKRIVPINDFMRETGPPSRQLQKLIDRMFDEN
ncbi:MAG: hypothetical protein WA840_22865 [Caulobacteraceae bacterium]